MIKYLKDFKKSLGLAKDVFFIQGEEKSKEEIRKSGCRTDVINKLLSGFDRPTHYLEVGVRDPRDNFLKIESKTKYSVDPGLEMEENLADFKCTSDEFFEGMNQGQWQNLPAKFDVIFIDGLHTAEQVDRDIANALEVLSEDGFVVLHDCNPPTQWHAREEFGFQRSPAGAHWNGTTWKAFVKWRKNKTLFSFCVDTDWGVGVLSKHSQMGKVLELENEFYEYQLLETRRQEVLNLISFEEFIQQTAI